MDFNLNEDLQMVRDMASAFAQAELAPNGQAWEAAGALPDDLFVRLGELGLMGIMVPEALGGVELGAMAYAVAVEEIAAGDASAALGLVHHNGLFLPRLVAANAGAVERFVTGEALGVWSGAASGLVPFADRADQVVVETDAGLAFVEVSAAAVTPRRTLGMKAAAAADLSFEGLRFAPVESQAVDLGRLGMAALAVGVGRSAAEIGARYATERKQFGKPLTKFQAMQWMVADSATELDAARLLVWRAATAIEAGGGAQEAAAALAFASEAAVSACDRAIQIHGGYGYTLEYDVQRLWRDARYTGVALSSMGELWRAAG